MSELQSEQIERKNVILEDALDTQNRSEIVSRPTHTIDGKFAPGNCANPGGRPKTRLLTEAYKQILEDEGAEKYAQVVTGIALSGKKDSDRLAAVQEIADRVEGKPVQTSNIRGIMVMMPAESLVTGVFDSPEPEE